MDNTNGSRGNDRIKRSDTLITIDSPNTSNEGRGARKDEIKKKMNEEEANAKPVALQTLAPLKEGELPSLFITPTLYFHSFLY